MYHAEPAGSPWFSPEDSNSQEPNLGRSNFMALVQSKPMVISHIAS